VLTKKGKYGLKAMVHLAGVGQDALAQVADIARANSISKGFLDQILTELRHAGLIYSKHGKRGGYALARPAEEIRVGAIVRVFDGPWRRSGALRSPPISLAMTARTLRPVRFAR
jgi:Rrf2 family protein